MGVVDMDLSSSSVPMFSFGVHIASNEYKVP